MNKSGITQLFVPIAALALLAGIFSIFRGTSPPIDFEPDRIETSVFQGGTRTLEIEFTSRKGFSNIEVFVVPELQPFIAVTPSSFTDLLAESSNTISIVIEVSREVPTGTVEGTIHLREGKKTIARPLPLVLNIIDPGLAEQKLDDLLIQKFGTSTPPIPEERRFLAVEPTPEFESLLTRGSNLPAVFRVSSPLTFEFNLSLETNADITSAISELLPIVAGEGIRVQDVVNALPAHRWHKEDLGRPLIPEGAVAITFLPPLHIVIYDQNGDGLSDTVVFIPTDTTHTILNLADTVDVIARNFTDAGITGAALTALHELAHVFNFRTDCGGSILGIPWYFLDAEEDFISPPSPSLQNLIQDIFANKNTTILNAEADSLLNTFSNAQNCLNRLDLTRPTPALLNVSSVSTSTISLSWSQNADRDFASYKLFRSASPNVDTNDTLVATITDPSRTSLTDTNLLSGTAFFYKLFVFDKAGLSSGSNEISVTTLAVGPSLFGNSQFNASSSFGMSQALTCQRFLGNGFIAESIEVIAGYKTLPNEDVFGVKLISAPQQDLDVFNRDPECNFGVSLFELTTTTQVGFPKTYKFTFPSPIVLQAGVFYSLEIGCTRCVKGYHIAGTDFESFSNGIAICSFTTNPLFDPNQCGRGQANTWVKHSEAPDPVKIFDYYFVFSGQPAPLNPPTNITTSTINLSWSQNINQDFASYKLFRSTSPNVDTNDTLVATITDPSRTSFTDTNLPSGTTFFYKLFVFDKAGLSSPSNEVSATTLAVSLLLILEQTRGEIEFSYFLNLQEIAPADLGGMAVVGIEVRGRDKGVGAQTAVKVATDCFAPTPQIVLANSVEGLCRTIRTIGGLPLSSTSSQTVFFDVNPPIVASGTFYIATENSHPDGTLAGATGDPYPNGLACSGGSCSTDFDFYFRIFGVGGL